MTHFELYQQIKNDLSGSSWLRDRGGLESEAEQIFIHGYQRMYGRQLSRAQMINSFRDELTESGLRDYCTDLARERTSGKPLQYLLGRQFFLEHEYESNA